jgi:hypothetical protein
LERAERTGQNSRETRGEIANLHLAVIARSEATKQSTLAVLVAAWIASQALAMTIWSFRGLAI